MPLVILLIIAAISGYADRARGPVVGLISVEPGVRQTISLQPRDLASLSSAGDERVIRAISLQISVPPAAASYRNAFLLRVYYDIRPEPSAIRMDYTSKDSMSVRIDGSGSYIIPLMSELNFGADNYLFEPVTYADMPLLITIEPISKALPDSLAAAFFEVSIEGVYADAGIIRVVIDSTGEERAFQIRLDGEPVSYRSDGYLVTPGIHKLEIFADRSFEYSRNVVVEPGTVVETLVVLETSRPTVRIEAPDNSQIFLDGVRYLPAVHGTVETVQGEHVVLVQMGDFSISRRFEVEDGNDYTISLFLDIIVEETEK